MYVEVQNVFYFEYYVIFGHGDRGFHFQIVFETTRYMKRQVTLFLRTLKAAALFVFA
jgi:hypothetical protein